MPNKKRPFLLAEGIPASLPSLPHILPSSVMSLLHGRRLCFFPSRLGSLNSSPEVLSFHTAAAFRKKLCRSCSNTTSALFRFVNRRLKKGARAVSKVDQLEVRRGKGLAIKFPLRKAEGEKGKREREEIWRERRRRSLPAPHFSSPLFHLSPPPSVSPPPFSFFSFFAVFLGESGRSEVNRK